MIDVFFMKEIVCMKSGVGDGSFYPVTPGVFIILSLFMSID